MNDRHSQSNSESSAGAEGISGPAPVEEEHFDSLIRLLNLVMRADSSRSMTEDFPYFLRKENRGNLLVCRHGESVVSHVGLLPVKASYFGHPLEIGMIGAVSTHPDYRRRGLASCTLEEAFRRFRRQGGHLLMISGRRNLYSRNGAREVGEFRHYVLPRGEERIGLDAELKLQKADEEQASEFASLHRRKPVRFLRPMEEWKLRMGEGVCRNRLSEFCLASRGGQPTAYAVFRVDEEQGRARCIVTEWGGRPGDACRAVSRRVRQERWASSEWTLYPHETDMAGVLDSGGARFKGHRAAGGSLRVADFCALMEALRGYLAELLGQQVAERLEFQEPSPGAFGVRLREDSLRIEGYGRLAEVLFGAGMEALPESLRDGPLKSALSAVLPLSPLNYDFSYV